MMNLNEAIETLRSAQDTDTDVAFQRLLSAVDDVVALYDEKLAQESGICPNCHEALVATPDGLLCAICYHVYGEADETENE